jgi:branched-chain amino acid transport system permease protein
MNQQSSSNDLAAGMFGGMMGDNRRRILTATAIAIAIVLPFLVKNFLIFQLTLAMVYAIAILGLNLLTGYNGQFSLGHSAFFAMGAYTAAIMMDQGDIAYYWTLPAAGIVCLISGFLFGLPALRLEGIYLALATFSLAVAAPQILKSSPLEPWTGGVQGITIIKPDAPFGLPLNSDQWLYFFTLAILFALFICAANLINSRTGRAIMAIRDNPIAARSMGIDIALYKSLTFGVSALYTGIAGALGAIVIQLVIGGVGSIAGTLFGGLFVLFVPNIAEAVSKGLAGAVYGIILILVIYLMPSGAAGLVRLVGSKFARRTR